MGRAWVPRLAFNARAGEIGMVNPREVIGIYTQCAGKSGSATAPWLREYSLSIDDQPKLAINAAYARVCTSDLTNLDKPFSN